MISTRISRRALLANLGMAATATAVARAMPQGVHARRAAAPADAPLVLLNSNENPYGPPPLVADALREALTTANRYPDSRYEQFLARVARLHAMPQKNVIAGCGSTEILKMAADAFTGPDRKLITATPTFEAIGHYARARGVQVETVPLTGDYAHDLERMLASAKNGAGLIYICNPNNPSATLTPADAMAHFIAQLPDGVYVLIDEAYHHFAMGMPQYRSSLEDAGHLPNRVIVARTFSKVYGLAGMRLGYGVSDGATIERMRSCQVFDNLNTAVAAAGSAALDDEGGMRSAVRRIVSDRDDFFRQAAARKLTTIPSCANFAMLKAGRPAGDVIRHFEQRGVLIGRRFPGFEHYVRISFGTPQQMQTFWRVWDEMPAA
jgi:histidinol-phosphate aminotransferase